MAKKTRRKAEKPAKTSLMSIKIHPEVYEKIKDLKSHPRESFSETLDRLATIAEKLLKYREYPRELPEDVLNRLLEHQPEKEPQTSRKEGFIA